MIPLSIALVAVAALAYRYFSQVHADRVPKDTHAAELAAVEARLKAVEETLRSEGRMAGLGAAFGRKK